MSREETSIGVCRQTHLISLLTCREPFKDALSRISAVVVGQHGIAHHFAGDYIVEGVRDEAPLVHLNVPCFQTVGAINRQREGSVPPQQMSLSHVGDDGDGAATPGEHDILTPPRRMNEGLLPHEVTTRAQSAIRI